MDAAVTVDGRLFQALVPAAEKDRSPNVDLRVAGTTNADELEDLRRCRDSNCECIRHACNYSVTLNNHEDGTLAADGLAVTFGTARRGLSGAAVRLWPLLAVPNITRGVAAGFGHHGMPPPGCNNIAAILLMSWATLLPILIILRLFVLELWAGRVRHTM